VAWPPRKVRSGTTRRQRTLAFLGRSFLLLVIGMALGLLIMSRFAPDRSEGLRGIGADMVAPIWQVVQVPVETVAGIWNNASAYMDAARRVKVLERREALYRQERLKYENALRENREMKRLLDVVDPAPEQVGVFAVSGAAGGAYAAQALISGGSRNGVDAGQPVRSDVGLIGRTLEVGRSSSRIMLITDPASRIPVRVVRTGLPALVIGTNRPTMDVDLTGPTSNQVAIGDRLVTSGDGGLFAPGIPVGTIVATGGEMPRARPAAIPSLAQMVIVDRPYISELTPSPPVDDDNAPEQALPQASPSAP
jgi:rod shape-determining protein MreC|tara:strand:+ start:115405 stop:116328 length:924 start_codon:yes stop_codon:yes gene_type:complete